MTLATAVHILFTSLVYRANVYWSVIHGIKRKPHLSVVWSWYHFVAIANLHQPRPTVAADINMWVIACLSPIQHIQQWLQARQKKDQVAWKIGQIWNVDIQGNRLLVHTCSWLVHVANAGICIHTVLRLGLNVKIRWRDVIVYILSEYVLRSTHENRLSSNGIQQRRISNLMLLTKQRHILSSIFCVKQYLSTYVNTQRFVFYSQR